MTQRILVLTSYLLRSTAWSLTGALYTIVALVFSYLLFQQVSPEPDYYIVVIMMFGGGLTFLVTLSTAGRAHRAENTTWIVRLPSRVEYLAAVLLAGLLLAATLQILVAVTALRARPELTAWRAAEIPPIWLAVNLLAGVLALHASDLVTRGWSRVMVYGVLLILLFSQSGTGGISSWIGTRLVALSTSLTRQGVAGIGDPLRQAGNWLVGSGNTFLESSFGLVFWPFRAITGGVIRGSFESVEALAPAFLVLYATLLFLMAADFFASKDLYFTE